MLVFECLAERTITAAQAALVQGLGPGYDPLLRERLLATLGLAHAHGTVIVTNSGAANPHGAGRLVLDVADALGIAGLTVAVADGDDVLDRLSFRDSPVLGGRDGETLEDHRDAVVGAHAYLGVDALVEGLRSGADVVITGRTSDAALFLAPLMHCHGWTPEDLDLLAAGSTVGHLLECAGQLTGGYFADGNAKHVPGLARLGFPMADVDRDGTARFFKLPGTGGRLDRATAVEQLLYEVSDPMAYLTPDVTVDLSAVRIEESGTDEVTVVGAVGRPAPTTLKVSVGIRDGFQSVAEISYAGPHAVDRALLAADIVGERWNDVHGLGHVQLSTELIGVNACTPWTDVDQQPGEVRLRLATRTLDEHAALLLGREVEALYTNGPSGGGGVVTRMAPTLGLLSTTIPRSEVMPTTTVYR
ncbi:MAG: transporter substrate-binding protein [Frankiales bacterium]|nr:transporter substrate-binding protein [Frankiales bacterium]